MKKDGEIFCPFFCKKFAARLAFNYLIIYTPDCRNFAHLKFTISLRFLSGKVKYENYNARNFFRLCLTVLLVGGASRRGISKVRAEYRNHPASVRTAPRTRPDAAARRRISAPRLEQFGLSDG